MRVHAFANAIVGRFPDGNGHPQRELVITVPLPEDRGRQGDARPKVHRFRSYGVELGQRLRAFRERHALTQAEVAAALGAGSLTPVTQWEIGARTPEGLLQERVEALVAGRLWPELRAAVVAPASASVGPDGNLP